MLLGILVVSVVLCRSHTAAKQPITSEIDFGAIQLIDYPHVSPPLNTLIEDAIHHRVVGKKPTDYAKAIALSYKTEIKEKYTIYEFELPLSETAKESLRTDTLVHLPLILVWVRHSDSMITRCAVYELSF